MRDLSIHRNVVENSSKFIDSPKCSDFYPKRHCYLFYIYFIVTQETYKWAIYINLHIPLDSFMSHYTLDVCNAEIIPKLIYLIFCSSQTKLNVKYFFGNFETFSDRMAKAKKGKKGKKGAKKAKNPVDRDSELLQAVTNSKLWQNKLLLTERQRNDYRATCQKLAAENEVVTNSLFQAERDTIEMVSG